jgi:hypothetical protein
MDLTAQIEHGHEYWAGHPARFCLPEYSLMIVADTG